MMRLTRIWRLGWVVALLLPLLLSDGRAVADDHEQAQALFEAMSVEERIGQLFLVTFEGDSAPQDSDIADLITNYQVGGVVLLADNDNITAPPDQLVDLTTDLQQLALLGTSSITTTIDVTDTVAIPPAPPTNPIPLFIATNYEGDNAPYSEIYGGLTAIPSNMAIGATWQPDNARAVGQTVGQELNGIGVNMLLGPTLDVLANPDPANQSDLGVRAFGGTPYWVGLMGEAYIGGIHQGSQDRIAVVAKHFPGSGSSDRSSNQEAPTIYKTLEDLLAFDLVPFAAVTNPAEAEGRADGLLASHIRYQGFQGNINSATAPVSFDQQAMATLMGLPAFSDWRSEGGVIVSDALGAHSIQQFYDDTGASFPHRLVAKDALLAGNDLLVLQNFALGDDGYATQLENTKDTILWFREKYTTDQLFQQRVDEAVLRILALKMRQYGSDFSMEMVSANNSIVPADADTGIVDVAQSAITLLSPSTDELAEQFSSPPIASDQITIFTDMRYRQQCAACEPEPYISETALADAILALYGPEASGQAQAEQISSYTFADLQAFLDAGETAGVLPELIAPELEEVITDTVDAETAVFTPTPPAAFRVNSTLEEADWIIFALLGDEGGAATSADALHNFLADRPDIIRNSNVIVFAYNAPYFLDSTEVSKLTAYFGVYSKIDAFVDASVRALYLESPLSGKPPVNVAGINYDLTTQTAPDPQQVIELFIADINGDMLSPESDAPLQTAVGDTLRLQTGNILDNNGNLVPDGTMVRFMERNLVQGTENIIDTIPSTNGSAALDYLLEARTSAGTFSISAYAGETEGSEEVIIKIADADEEAEIIIITPTPLPTAVPTVTPTPTPEPTPQPTPTFPASPTPIPPPQEPSLLILLSQVQLLGMLFLGLGIVVGGITAVSHQKQWTIRQRIEGELWTALGALIAYIYLIVGLPGTDILSILGSWSALLATLTGGGVMAGIFIFRRRERD